MTHLKNLLADIVYELHYYYRCCIRRKQIFYSRYYTKDIPHICTSCYHRHSFCDHEPKGFCRQGDKVFAENCKYWESGGCYSCEKYRLSNINGDEFTASEDDLWYANGCESECMSGCSKWELRKDFNEVRKH